MSLEAWLLFRLTETVLCFTPGPAVLLGISSMLIELGGLLLIGAGTPLAATRRT